jgi:hypothetical protein
VSSLRPPPAHLLLCPCGAAAPSDLLAPGRVPGRCLQCSTPLVRPGGVPRDDVERALGAALLMASVLAVAWMFAARATDGAAHWTLPIAGVAIGAIARVAARGRGPAVQRAAALSFAAFVALGEVLLYRGALLTRLIALHEFEGAENAELLALQEIEETGFAEYLHVELTLWLFVGAAVGLLLALRLTRAPVAVEAFLAPVGSVPTTAGPEVGGDPPAHDQPSHDQSSQGDEEDPSWP